MLMIRIVVTACPTPPWTPHAPVQVLLWANKGGCDESLSVQFLTSAVCCRTEKKRTELNKTTNRYWSYSCAPWEIIAARTNVTQSCGRNISLRDVFPIHCTCCRVKCFWELKPGLLLAGGDFIASSGAAVWLPSENRILMKTGGAC